MLKTLALALTTALSAPAPAQDLPAADPATLTEAGNRFLRGEGVPQDDARAAELYQLAAARGDAQAMHNLGLMYAEGRGVPQDEFIAVEYYRAAMAQGYVPAITSLGIAYAEGRGVSIEPATARTLLAKAAAAGDQRAKDYLARAGLRP
jgi:TPR repeat protein